MAVVRSGATTDEWTIDPTSKAGRLTEYNSLGREISIQSKASYIAANTFTPAATPTDVVTITGSGTKTIQIVSFKITTTNTAAGSQEWRLIKRSTADTAGTFVAGTAIPLDSNDPAATATVGHYTANPTLGTAVGTMLITRLGSPAAVPGSFGSQVEAGSDLLILFGLPFLARAMTLRGAAQQLCLNFNGAALVAGQTHAWSIAWTEE